MKLMWSSWNKLIRVELSGVIHSQAFFHWGDSLCLLESQISLNILKNFMTTKYFMPHICPLTIKLVASQNFPANWNRISFGITKGALTALESWVAEQGQKVEHLLNLCFRIKSLKQLQQWGFHTRKNYKRTKETCLLYNLNDSLSCGGYA